MTIDQFEASDVNNGPQTRPVPRAGPPDDTVRQFVEHWGMMARAWGINASMGELFALLYITGGEWTADALKESIDVSRGNVSMNLRELISWGVVHKVHRPGERREFYRAETDVWILFRRILSERKRRELDPTLVVLERTVELIEQRAATATATDAEPQAVSDPSRLERIASLRRLLALINTLATRLLTLDPEELDALLHLFEPDPEPDSPPPV
jgi:DNA-binding transcriptional regulator GbsR (MarR family)